jgi:sugar fermentation stimulation protein A
MFDPPLVPARLIKRYKRFLADVRFENGQELTVHCPNTGSMLGLNMPGMRVWLRDTANPARKYRWSWELAEPTEGCLVGINTGTSNGLVKAALQIGLIPQLAVFDVIRREVQQGNSRLDFLLRTSGGDERCFLEVKNVTTAGEAGEPGVAVFPDAVSERASRHLRELIELKHEGHRCGLVYCVQREDIDVVRPAVNIDPVYAQTLELARESGVELYALGATLSTSEVRLTRSVEVRLR